MSKLELKSGDFNPSTLWSCQAVTHAPLEAIAAVTCVRVQDVVPSKPKRAELWSIFLVRGIMLLSIPVLSTDTKKRVSVSGTEPII